MPFKDIEEIVDKVNLVEDLSDEQLIEIKNQVCERFEEDKQSQQKWMEQAKDAIEMASLKCEPKHTPFRNASNVKYPVIATATTQFAARTMPEIVRGEKVVEIKVVGEDPDGQIQQRAKMVSNFMSYQLLINSNKWTESLDRLLHLYANIGTVFKKIYYDPVKQEYVYKLCKHDEVYVNNDITSIEEAQAITHLYLLSLNDIVSYTRAGVFAKADIDKEDKGSCDIETSDKSLHEILEQHCFLDLDYDGYAEPYIVTIHRKTEQVLRVVPRFLPSDILRNDKGEIIKINPINMFIDYHFLPSMDGSFYSMGFGTLLTPLNHTINSLINQLSDAGKLANMQSGFISKQLRLKGNDLRMNPGEWKVLDNMAQSRIRDNLYQIDYKEPSNTLFTLLGLLIESTKDLASVSDILQGDQLAQNAPATSVLALIEQGLKLHNSILKRLFTSLKKEFELIFKLNSVYVDPAMYSNVLNIPVEAITARDGTVIDFNLEGLDIAPVADPNMASDAKRAAQSQFLMSFLGSGILDDQQIAIRALQNAEIPRIEELLKPPAPNLAEIQMQAEMADKQAGHQLRALDLDIKQQDANTRELIARTNAIKALSDAEENSKQTQIDAFKAEVDAQAATIKAVQEQGKIENEMREKEEQSDNQGDDS